MPHIHEKIDFTVETFVVYKDTVLLRLHDKYNLWFSVGGHVELDEDPNQAAIREIKEEVGLDISLYDDNQLFKTVEQHNLQLIPPMALVRHNISPTHEHVSLFYFAKSDTDAVIPEKPTDQWKWLTKAELDTMDLMPHVKFYAAKALDILGTK